MVILAATQSFYTAAFGVVHHSAALLSIYIVTLMNDSAFTLSISWAHWLYKRNAWLWLWRMSASRYFWKCWCTFLKLADCWYTFLTMAERNVWLHIFLSASFRNDFGFGELLPVSEMYTSRNAWLWLWRMSASSLVYMYFFWKSHISCI